MANDKYTAEQMIEALRATRGMITLAAKRLHCAPNTIRSYVERYPTVAQAMREEREQATDVAELALYKAIQDGQPWAVCFYLKTQGRARGYVERYEVEQRMTIDWSKVPDAALESFLAKKLTIDDIRLLTVNNN